MSLRTWLGVNPTDSLPLFRRTCWPYLPRWPAMSSGTPLCCSWWVPLDSVLAYFFPCVVVNLEFHRLCHVVRPVAPRLSCCWPSRHLAASSSRWCWLFLIASCHLPPSLSHPAIFVSADLGDVFPVVTRRVTFDPISRGEPHLQLCWRASICASYTK